MSNNERKEGNLVFKGKTDAIYKVIVIGDPGVGKTELLTKFATNQFEEKYLPTVGVSILKEPVELRDFNATINLMFWDIAGQPQFYMLHYPYFNGADFVLLTFDITRSSTFSNVNNWYSSAVKYGLSGIPRILVGIKKKISSEQSRKIILPMAEHLSEKINAPYFEVSLDTGENVRLVFKKIAELVHRSKFDYNTEKTYRALNIKAKKSNLECNNKVRKLNLEFNNKARKPNLKWFSNKYDYSRLTTSLPLVSETRKNLPFMDSKLTDSCNDYDYIFKSIIVGDSGVGKTALAFRFSKNIFWGGHKTTGVDFHSKNISIETREGPIRAQLQLWDIGGQEKFSSIRPMYYRGAQGAVLVFDLTNSSSFEHLHHWIEDIRYNVKKEIPLLLVGNKSDLSDERQVSLEEINSFKRNFNLYYMETSARTGECVNDCFFILTRLVLGLELPKRSIKSFRAFRTPKSPLGSPNSAKDRFRNMEKKDLFDIMNEIRRK